MKSASHRINVKPPLTDLENAVMKAVWDLGPSTVEAVHGVVSRDRDLKEATIRTLLRRLEQKGHLNHKEAGRAYVYQAMERPRGLAARAVRHIIDRFCQGSVEELVGGMVDAKVLTPDEMKRLEAFVRKHRRDTT